MHVLVCQCPGGSEGRMGGRHSGHGVFHCICGQEVGEDPEDKLGGCVFCSEFWRAKYVGGQAPTKGPGGEGNSSSLLEGARCSGLDHCSGCLNRVIVND